MIINFKKKNLLYNGLRRPSGPRNENKSKLAERKYKTRHYWVGKVNHWELCKKFKLDCTNKWYMRNPESVLENETRKILWDFDVQTDHLISARHPNLVIIFTQPLCSGRIWYKVNFFKRSLTGLNSEFSFSYTSCLTKAEEPSLPYYLPIAGGRIIGFIPFPRVLVLCEMQSVSSKIWTRVAVSISCDDNHYTTGTSFPKTSYSQKKNKKENLPNGEPCRSDRTQGKTEGKRKER